ncbi:hypothetical protein BDB01DRAFT_841649 [Pilobolus umbonatus]|nr:hypothetical protein BDB01DRAFT_841649 [Pilobolus umbonatus]
MSHSNYSIQWDELQDEPLHTSDLQQVTLHDPLSDKNNEPAVLNSHTKGSVRRRFQDFVWLHNVFYTTYPACFIPPLPNKHRLVSLSDRFNAEFIEKRRISLERFMQRIARHPILGQSEIFMMFLASTEFNDASARALRDGQKTMFDTLGDTLLNAFAKIRKPDPRFIEMKERCERMEENLDMLQRTLLRTNKRYSDLQGDYHEFTESVRGLAEIEPSYRDFLLQFADCLEGYSDHLKKSVNADEEWQIEINDYMAYYHDIKDVLKLRDQKQLDYEELTMYLKSTVEEREKIVRDRKSEGVTGFITGKINEARGADYDKMKRERVLRLDERVRELQEAIDQTHDISTAFSDQVKKEDVYFNRNKCVELYHVLQSYTDAKINHYQEVMGVNDKYVGAEN